MKPEIIQYLMDNGSIKLSNGLIQGNNKFSTDDPRIFPYSNGESLRFLGKAYSNAISAFPGPVNSLYSINTLSEVISISIALSSNRSLRLFNQENLPTKEDLPTLALITDSLDKKIHDTKKTVDRLGYTGRIPLFMFYDREEINSFDIDPIQELEKEYNFIMIPVLTATDFYSFIREHGDRYNVSRKDVLNLENYLRVYGTEKVRRVFNPLEQKIVQDNMTTVLPLLNSFSITELSNLLHSTSATLGIGGYVITDNIISDKGLQKTIETIKRFHPNKPIIYQEHSLSEINERQCKHYSKNGIDAVLLDLKSGPNEEKESIYRLLSNNLKIILGLSSISDLSYIPDENILRFYEIGAESGLKNYYIPRIDLKTTESILRTITKVPDPVIFSSQSFNNLSSSIINNYQVHQIAELNIMHLGN